MSNKLNVSFLKERHKNKQNKRIRKPQLASTNTEQAQSLRTIVCVVGAKPFVFK